MERGQGNECTAEEAPPGFERFPTWMWRNRDIVALATSLSESLADA